MYSLSVPKENQLTDNKNIEIEMNRMMEAYGNDVLRTSYMFLKDYHKAEDAFQEVFIKVFNKYNNFKGECSEKTWIIKITINTCKDILRSAWLRRVHLTDTIMKEDSCSGIEGKIVKSEENKLLFQEVISLKTVYKEVIILYYYQDYDTLQISQILNIAEGTVRSRLYRAREILKTKLEGRVDFNG
jgi:RNA polymerase sigma factor, sigma-70 family